MDISRVNILNNTILICFGYSSASGSYSISLPMTYTNNPKIITQKGSRSATSITYIGTTEWNNRQELVYNISKSSFYVVVINKAGYTGCNWISIGF